MRPAGSFGAPPPGPHALKRADHLGVNPSDYFFPAFPALAGASLIALGAAAATADAAAAGAVGAGSGRRLVAARLRDAARCRPWRPPRFPFDAVRAPVWLAWAGLRQEPALLRAHRFWMAAAPPAAWGDLATDSPAPYPAPAGLVAAARPAAPEGGTGPSIRSLAIFVQLLDYYSAMPSFVRLGFENSLPSRDRRNGYNQENRFIYSTFDCK